jgi:hypothetical protein
MTAGEVHPTRRRRLHGVRRRRRGYMECPEEGGYMVRTRNYVANDDQKNRAVRNAGHHP